MLVSVVVPCYNEEAVIRLYYEEMNKVTELLTDYDFELIFVNDGSKDGTLGILKEFASKDNRVKFISFSRNFGKESAMYAGLKNSNGDYVVLMDADLQDPPKTLIEMLRIATEEGYDSVATRRMTRKGEPPIRSFFARQFYKIMNKISKTDIVDGARDYRLMSRNFVDSLLRMSEYSRFSKGLFGWVGFKTKWIDYENVERAAGETKWSFWKLLLYSIEGIVAFSTLPPQHFGVFWDYICLPFFYRIGLCCDKGGYFWRFCSGLAFHDVYYPANRRSSVDLYRYPRNLPFKGLFRSKEKTYFYLFRQQYKGY